MKILFDCDDTLYDSQWPFRMAVYEVIPEYKDYDLNKFYADYRKKGDTVFHLIQNGTITSGEAGVFRIENVIKDYGSFIDHETAIRFQNTYKYYQYKISMTEEFKEYLMKQDIEYGILTNGESQHQRNKMKALQVTDFVSEDHIFTSQEVGYAKPNVKAFETVLEKLNGKAEDWYYIGDHYENDIKAPKTIGMKTIHFNRHHQETGDSADYIVYSEDELMKLIDTLK